MLVWANLHGGFTLGLLLCGAFALEALVGARETSERKALFVDWVKFGVAAVLVACITPYGAGIDPGHLAHLRPRRCAGHDQRMAVAQLPEHAAAGS